MVMRPLFPTFTAALKRSLLGSNVGRPTTRFRYTQFVCRSCQQKFSTSPTLRLLGGAKKVAEKERKYKSRLLIYDAGDARTTWISFWKAVALLQCGTTFVFAVPLLWKNENEPDPRLRKATAILVGILGTIPTLTLGYLTAPFTHRVYLQIPEYARRSRKDLMHFANTLITKPVDTANTKLEFVTLRIFPFRKQTSVFLHELRALPPKKMRFANIELPKSDDWVQRQRQKGLFKRFYEAISEPRFKFFVKEGRSYTMKTGVPGVWEEVAKRIQQQTLDASRLLETPAKKTRTSKPIVYATLRPATSQVQMKIKRQTARQVKR
ncbi:hypothetical protein HBI56_001950 [Parastagonospora nodorum]|uniref:Uncharacterized protein n=1 Tax=Phaeosphaeria nodorum (strain SN15 / ATCC MYA-4574 / FGSC 10173) TaxID=321614 RepID=A0A7U2HTP7_PHANO|nr:hypothetical protein HBH56_139140 [Parastagonospora nodorum]QRC91455.1 hypothetical protein JI435_009640 [Parastagonospora nodorum SN15]KAH3928058.1 hypothetical protein HBH54_144280 [Parastagonospora nodorum]KAH3948993.1 hypothetical protein HBH53_094280 [Parastagonospora nodorum]KAH3972468.1 hypothetical protein HBH52_150980 [Parastagonospora nodorum]